MGGILQKMLQAFYTKKLEVVLVGLENRFEEQQKSVKKIYITDLMIVLLVRYCISDGTKNGL